MSKSPTAAPMRKKEKAKDNHHKRGKKKKKKVEKDNAGGGNEEEDEDVEEGGCCSGSSGSSVAAGGRGGRRASERHREHPFIVTEPGEVARAKKNGIDYLFHLYDQCRHFFLQVQSISKEHGQKCPTRVTNQVFRYAKNVGASSINKPKMRHYAHCYALHCLDEEASKKFRRDFNAHPHLSIWYVPTNLCLLCHLARSNASPSSATATTSVLAAVAAAAAASDELRYPPPMF